jgi:hypothetical protein
MAGLVPQAERSGTPDAPTWPLTLEVRWIQPGVLPPPLVDHLGPFGDDIERRKDRYLIDPFNPELSVKIRGGIQLDLKAYRGSPGEIRIPGWGVGQMELWEKWAAPFDPDRDPPAEASGWVAVRKVRRRRSFAIGPDGIAERPLVEAMDSPGSTVELTDVELGDDVWWTLGFEASGPPELLEPDLRATMTAVLSDSLPKGIDLRLRDSTSYVRWLGARVLGRGKDPSPPRPEG